MPLTTTASARIVPSAWDSRLTVQRSAQGQAPASIRVSVLELFPTWASGTPEFVTAEEDLLEITPGKLSLDIYTTDQIDVTLLTRDSYVSDFIRPPTPPAPQIFQSPAAIWQARPIPVMAETDSRATVSAVQSCTIAYETIRIDGQAGATVKYRPYGPVGILHRSDAVSVSGRRLRVQSPEPGVFTLPEPGYWTAVVTYETRYRTATIEHALFPSDVSADVRARLLGRLIVFGQWADLPMPILIRSQRTGAMHLHVEPRPKPAVNLLAFASASAESALGDMTEVSRSSVERVIESDDGEARLTIQEATRIQFRTTSGRTISMTLQP